MIPPQSRPLAQLGCRATPAHSRRAWPFYFGGPRLATVDQIDYFLGSSTLQTRQRPRVCALCTAAPVVVGPVKRICCVGIEILHGANRLEVFRDLYGRDLLIIEIESDNRAAIPRRCTQAPRLDRVEDVEVCAQRAPWILLHIACARMPPWNGGFI